MTENTIMMTPVTRLHPHPQNVRSDLGDLRTLVKSIEAQGVLEPLLVRKNDDGWEVIAGHRRLAAATTAGLEEVPVIVRELTDEAAIAVMLVENLQREDIDPYDEARGYFRLVEFGWTQKKLADEVGVSAATVRNRLRLLQLPTAWAVDDPYTAEDLSDMVALTDHEQWDDEALVEKWPTAPAVRDVDRWLQTKTFDKEIEIIVDTLPEGEPLIEKESQGDYGGRRALPKNHIFVKSEDTTYDEDSLDVDLDTLRENGHLGWHVDVRGYGDKRGVAKLAVITDRGYYTRKSSPIADEDRPEAAVKMIEHRETAAQEREKKKEEEALRQARIKDVATGATKTELLSVIIDRGINDLRFKQEKDAAIALGHAVYFTAEQAEDDTRQVEGEYDAMATKYIIEELSQVKRAQFLAYSLLLDRSGDMLSIELMDEYAPLEENV